MNILLPEEQSAISTSGTEAAPTSAAQQELSHQPVSGEQLAKDYYQRQLDVLEREAKRRKLQFNLLRIAGCLVPVIFSVLAMVTRRSVFFIVMPFISVVPVLVGLITIMKALPYIGNVNSEQVVRGLKDGRLRPGLWSVVRHAAHECLQNMAVQRARNEQDR